MKFNKKFIDINTNSCKLNEKILGLISKENIRENEIAQRTKICKRI